MEKSPPTTAPEGAPQSAARPDRRAADRRVRPTPVFSRWTLFGGRRAGDRRGGEAGALYVDLYEPGLGMVLVGIGLLCALDGLFTLLYIQKGGAEANPAMAALHDSTGPATFVVIKCAITNAGLVVLCLHKNFRYVKGVIGSLAAVYAGLFLYHLYLAATVL